MNTNQDARREALQSLEKLIGCELEDFGPLYEKVHAYLSQPMPEAAAQKTPLDKLRHEMRLVTALTLKNPGVAITLPDLMATEGRKFMRGETSLFDQLPFGEMQSVTAMLSASPAAPEGAKPEREIEQLIRERDQRDEIIDRLCDAVLGSERPEWSSTYGFDDAVADVEERITQLHQPSVDKAWKRFEQANAAQPSHPQPQAQGEPNKINWVDYARVEQSHREALAKRDAALVACVAALKLAMHWAGPAMERDMRSPSNSQWMVEKTQAQEDSIYAAIIHANQVLGRKEGGV